MTYKQVRDNFVQDLAENAYLTMSTSEEMELAISALDKQIPHKLKPNNSQSKGGCIPVCGKCNGIMDLEQGDLNYCPNCGQALDWSDEE